MCRAREGIAGMWGRRQRGPPGLLFQPPPVRVPSGPLLRPAGLREALSVAHSDFSREFGFLEPFAGDIEILLRIWPLALYTWLYGVI